MKKFSKKTPIILIKLGGSIITNKESHMSLRKSVIKKLVRQIIKIQTDFPDKKLIISHGQGSFAHVPAHKYKTMDGFINEDSVYGMAVVQNAAAQLNRAVVKEFLKEGIPAATFAMSNSLITNNKKAVKDFFGLLETYLEKGLFPITCGDVIVDESMGCTIWSTEKILGHFVKRFKENGYCVEKVIHLTGVAGFLDKEKEVIPEITNKNWENLKSLLTKTKGIDVTGGMSLKIEESLMLANKYGVNSYIISEKNNNLYKLLADKKWLGTKIS